MAAVRVYAIACDVPECGDEADRTLPGGTAEQTRKANAEAGWHVSGGKDVSPDCWIAGWRYGRDGWTCG